VSTRSRLLTTLMLAVPLAVAACSSGGSSSPAGTGSAATIVVGTTLSLSGSLDGFGAPLEAGYKQEVADVNATGGIAIGGVKERLKLVVMDNGSNPSTASSQATELVQRDHAVALLGSGGAQIVTPVALTAEQLRVPFLTSLMPVEAFASGDKTGWTYSWDLFYDEQQQATDTAKALAAVASNKKVVLFTDSDPADVVERPLQLTAFKAAGLDVVGDYTVPVGTTNFSSQVAAAKATGAQLLTGDLTDADGVALWQQLKSAGLTLKAALLAAAPDAGSGSQPLPALAQDTLTDGYWTTSQASPGQLASITPTLGKEYAGSPDYATAAVGYAVAQVLTDALATAGSTNPGRLNTAISKTDAPTTAGPIRFNQTTHTATTPYYVTGRS
jgi:branched-chain amino acid transport system substrate-binding protein